MAILRKSHRPPAFEEPMFRKKEMQRLDHLIGAALTSRAVYQRLIHQHDPLLQQEFSLAPETWQYLTAIRVTSLEELCDSIMQLQTKEERAS